MITTILVVDDEPVVCQLLCAKLNHDGFECRAAASAEEALHLMESTRFDVIISDLHLPAMSGLEFLKVIQKKDLRPAFLMVTGEGDVRVAIDAMKLGADDYLVKPFQLAGVVAGIERALEKRRLEAELANYRQNLESMVEQRTEQLQTAMNRIEKVYDETLEALGAALDLRDTATEGHSRRVSRCCEEIAKALGCGSEELKHIARGSYLHDVGKIGIPDTILLKPGRLTDEETVVMRSHAQFGHSLVSRIGFLSPAAEMVLTHHERFDGTGYPQGLLGEAVPLGSRIFAVADTLDAVTSSRPYRPARPLASAREEIVRATGLQFDPRVVNAFLSIPSEVWEGIQREVPLRRASSSDFKVESIPAPWLFLFPVPERRIPREQPLVSSVESRLVNPQR